MTTTRMAKTFSLSIELVKVMDSYDKPVNFSRVVENLLYDYLKKQGAIPNIPKNK